MTANSGVSTGSSQGASPEVRVWDPVVRYGHWTLVALFAIAYFTEDEILWLHSWAGYGIGAYLVIRLVWSFIGTKHARFSDFAYGWRSGLKYFGDLLLFRSKRYLGHSPAGAMMVFALLISLTLTVVSGLVLLAVEENAGPLAPWLGGGVAVESVEMIALASENEAGEGEKEGSEGEKGAVLEEIHEVLANFTLILVLGHIGGVILASVAHRENLARAMVTGRKRAE